MESYQNNVRDEVAKILDKLRQRLISNINLNREENGKKSYQMNIKFTEVAIELGVVKTWLLIEKGKYHCDKLYRRRIKRFLDDVLSNEWYRDCGIKRRPFNFQHELETCGVRYPEIDGKQIRLDIGDWDGMPLKILTMEEAKALVERNKANPIIENEDDWILDDDEAKRAQSEEEEEESMFAEVENDDYIGQYEAEWEEKNTAEWNERNESDSEQSDEEFDDYDDYYS
jgi:hypothetical protein